MSVVDNDFVKGDLFTVLEAPEVARASDVPPAHGNGATANGGSHAAAEPERLVA